MKIRVIKDIQHLSLLLEAGQVCNVEDYLGRRWVYAGWAIDLNKVMHEPQTEEKAAPESATAVEVDTKKSAKKKTKDTKGG